MNTGADKFGVIGNYVDTTGKTFKKSQSIEPPKRRQEGKSADYGFCPVYDSERLHKQADVDIPVRP